MHCQRVRVGVYDRFKRIRREVSKNVNTVMVKENENIMGYMILSVADCCKVRKISQF